MTRHLTDQKHENDFSWTRTKVSQFILCMIFLMSVATIQHLNYSRQESKQGSKKTNFRLNFRDICDLQIKSRSSNLQRKCRPRVQSSKDLAITVSEKKAMIKCFFFKRDNMSVTSLEHVRKSQRVVYSWSSWNNQQSYKV